MRTCLEHKHDMSRNYHDCSDIPCLCSNDVCSESKLHSGRFRAQTWYVHLWQLLSETTLYMVRLQLYKSCTMMFTLVSIIYPLIIMVGQSSEITEHLQTFNVDYLGTSKMDISWLCSCVWLHACLSCACMPALCVHACPVHACLPCACVPAPCMLAAQISWLLSRVYLASAHLTAVSCFTDIRASSSSVLGDLWVHCASCQRFWTLGKL